VRGGYASQQEKENQMSESFAYCSSKELSNWIIEDGFSSIEDGTFRISKGTIMFYDSASDEYVPTAVQYDAPQDVAWGKFKSHEDLSEPSNHEWTNREGEYKEWSWNITDGWSEADALGLPGLYSFNDQVRLIAFVRNQIVCQSCFITTNKKLDECEHCYSSLRVMA
jgi:hypothetical protein